MISYGTVGRRSTTLCCVLNVLCLLCLIGSQSSAQGLTNSQRPDSSAGLQGYSFGFNKVAGTFIFKGDAQLNQDVGNGHMLLSQFYRGSTIRSVAATFRDDEVFSMQYSYGNNAVLMPLFQTNIQVSRDSRSIGLSSLTRLNAALGLRSGSDSSMIIEAQLGAESNKLLGVEDKGIVTRLRAGVQNIDLDQYRLSSRLQSEISIFPRRTNGDVEASVYLAREFDARNALRLNLTYRTLNRDWYSQITLDTAAQNFIETRLEHRFVGSAQVLVGVTNDIQSEITTSLSDGSIARAFKDASVLAPSTLASRSLDELQFSINASTRYSTSSQQHVFSLGYFSRVEQNIAARHFASLGSAQLDTLQEQERIRDNTMGRTQIALRSYWNLSRSDTLLLDGAYSIMRYDTPSTQNNDDRDELSAALMLGLAHRFNSTLAVNLSAHVQLNHIVFLKASRSALNGWNRIIQLSPTASISTPLIRLNPQFEVLAQYTVYDFEGKAGVPSSFSFRQISYRDSISIPLTQLVSVETKLYLRRFQRGQLFWSSFAELEQSRNYEQFIRVLIDYSPEHSLHIGVGARWYALSQENLLTSSVNNTTLQSYGPECAIAYSLSPTLQLSLSGWYEFQYQNHLHSRDLPNMLLSIRESL